jgi:hypothetical protein
MEINFQDAQQALGFIAPQLLRINAEIDMQVYPAFDYSRLMFVNTDGDMWDVGTIFYSGDIAGKAEWLSHKGFDMPYADISTSQYMQSFHFAGIGYEWSLGELQRAAKVNRNLGNEKAAAARGVAEARVYGIAMRGDAEKAMTGIVNDPNVPAALVAADGTAGATTFASKTPTLINRDINAVLNAPFNATREVHRANTLLLPSTRLQYMASTPLAPGSDTTILKFIRENNSYTLETGQALTIIGTRELEAAGAGGTARMLAYDNARQVVQFHLPGPHEFLPAFQKSSMTCGVEVRRPKAMAYRDGI